MDAAGWIALGAIEGLGGASYRKLLSAFGDPEIVLKAGRGDLCKVVDSSLASRILQGPDQTLVEKTLRWLEDPACGIVTLADEDYPRLLFDVPDPPPFFYFKGNRALLGKKALAVVGSRNATPQGIENARQISRALSDSGLSIVSGLAHGIDAAAHEGGLAGASSSIAVIGTGMDIRYPSGNSLLAQRLEKEGLIISEFPLGMPPLAGNFPRRNRIISGLCLGCLVVEAGIRSGSLITARYAMEQGREIFAVPGSIHSPLSKGPHKLIKQGAKLVESANDILEELNLPAYASQEGKQLVQDSFLDAMGFDPVDQDVLCERTGLAAQAVSARLLELEMSGIVKRMAGGMYQRLS